MVGDFSDLATYRGQALLIGSDAAIVSAAIVIGAVEARARSDQLPAGNRGALRAPWTARTPSVDALEGADLAPWRVPNLPLACLPIGRKALQLQPLVCHVWRQIERRRDHAATDDAGGTGCSRCRPGRRGR